MQLKIVYREPVTPRRSWASIRVIFGLTTAFLLGASVVAADQAGEQSLSVQAPTEFTFPIPGAGGATLSFLLFSNAGTIADVRVVPRELKDPLGRFRDADLLHIPSPIGTVSAEGTPIEFSPDPSLFSRTGDYSAVLVAYAGGEQGKSIKPLPINLKIKRPVAEINLPQMSDQTIALTRSSPFGEARGEAFITLQETSGNADILDLALATHPLFLKATKRQEKATITAALVPDSSIKTNLVPALRSRRLRLNFSGISHAGEYATEIALVSLSLGGLKTIPVNVVVSDPWAWALAAIFLGVLGGYLTHFYSENWRPRRINTYNIVQLRSETNQFLANTTEIAKVKKLTEIQELIQLGERLNDLGQAADAKAQLDRARQLLDEFRKNEAARADAAAKAAATPLHADEPRIHIKDLPRDRTTDIQIDFEVVGLKQALAADDDLRWYFGDGGERSGLLTSHRFVERGDYTVKAEVLRGKEKKTEWQLTEHITILSGRTALQLHRLWHEIQAVDIALSLVALVLACLGGLAFLYVGKTFGSLADYVGAATWGFGLDNSVRGFSAILKKITTTT